MLQAIKTELWWLWRRSLVKLGLLNRKIIQIYHGIDTPLMKVELYMQDVNTKKFFLTNQQKREIRQKLSEFQKGRCYWCGRDMILVVRQGEFENHPRLCSLDHFYDRWTPELRAAHPRSYVGACQECNNLRSRLNQAAQPIEVLHERASRHRSDKSIDNGSPRLV